MKRILSPLDVASTNFVEPLTFVRRLILQHFVYYFSGVLILFFVAKFDFITLHTHAS